ncbi:RagB/SusD family nutrient uptake outer membrane protein [Dysgonomonas reticulitermitis]
MIHKNSFIKLFAIASLSMFSVACVDVDLQPKTSIPADVYFDDDAQVKTYVDNLYAPRTGSNSFDQEFSIHTTYSYGTFALDNNSDNQTNKYYDKSFSPSEYQVGASGGDWSFGYIYKCNYFFQFALPKYEAGQIGGNANNVKHYIGEVYFLRAYEYFKKLQNIGDFPIITDILPNDKAVLIEQSKRRPRTEVAHFILEDLDKAIELMSGDGGTAKTRITQNAALLFKSRVALYEGTWLKYFKGTAFVPNGTGWPGATKDYNSGYTFPKGSIDNEITFFLDEAANAAKLVADAINLTPNSGVLPQSNADGDNQYIKMFGDVNLNGYPEVLFWKQYVRGLTTHNVVMATNKGCYNTGLTRGYVDNFLMEDGTPVYAAGAAYKGDDDLSDVVENRDGRLRLFLKLPGQLNYWKGGAIDAPHTQPLEPYPAVYDGGEETGYSTGYTIRKGISFETDQLTEHNGSTTGCIIFRAAEAYLNYIEASYEKNGTLDATAKDYWAKIRSRAEGQTVTWSEIQTNTINKTDITKEAPNDWAAYSAGALLTDPTLYSIRRERRMEFLAEGLRKADLKRWRALDQLITTPYHIEGFKLWGGMQNEYAAGLLKPGVNVSSPSQSLYIRPLEVDATSKIAINGGFTWRKAHYLSPIAVEHFLLSSSDGSTIESSPIYQNPYWPTRPEPATE